MKEINELYESISKIVIKKVLTLGGKIEDANVLLKTANDLHVLILEKQNALPKHWTKKEKEFALNNCWYQLLKYPKVDLAHNFYEEIYHELTASSNRMDFLKFLSKFFQGWNLKKEQKRRSLKETSISIFSDFFIDFSEKLRQDILPYEDYIFIPFKAYIISGYENHIFYYENELTGQLYEYIKKEIVRPNTSKTKDIESLFHLVFSDLLEKAQLKILNPRRSSLVNFIKGACFNQQRNKDRDQKNKQARDSKLLLEMERLGKNKESNNFKEDQPTNINWAKEQIEKAITPEYKTFVQLRAQNKSYKEIAKMRNYKNEHVAKTKFYKNKKRVQKVIDEILIKEPDLKDPIYDWLRDFFFGNKATQKGSR